MHAHKLTNLNFKPSKPRRCGIYSNASIFKCMHMAPLSQNAQQARVLGTPIWSLSHDFSFDQLTNNDFLSNFFLKNSKTLCIPT